MNKMVKELERYRLEHRVSQEELAKDLKVAFCTVNRWFNGHNRPGKIHSYQINKLLKLKRSN